MFFLFFFSDTFLVKWDLSTTVWASYQLGVVVAFSVWKESRVAIYSGCVGRVNKGASSGLSPDWRQIDYCATQKPPRLRIRLVLFTGGVTGPLRGHNLPLSDSLDALHVLYCGERGATLVRRSLFLRARRAKWTENPLLPVSSHAAVASYYSAVT